MTAAISCEGVWQVFGANAETRLEAALSAAGGDVRATARELQSAGLIPAVRDASFEVAEGELFVIMGLSGSGKSTLVRGLSALVPATRGRIELEGEDIRSASKQRLLELRRQKLGMVFQHFGLFPHMTVLQNVAFPLKVQGTPRAAREAKAIETLEMVGLSGRENAFPRELSGGQRQRVGIARSLVGNCSLWFLDEPFSALDPLIRRQLQDEFLEIRKRFNTTIVFITHDIAEALKLADRIAIMKDGEIVQIGTPSDIVLNPVNDYVRAFSRDVVKGRHARLASVMKGRNGEAAPADGGPVLTRDMTLEDALGACMNAADPVPVQDDAGAVVGMVHPRDLARALTAGEE